MILIIIEMIKQKTCRFFFKFSTRFKNMSMQSTFYNSLKIDRITYTVNLVSYNWKHPLDSYQQAGTFQGYNSQYSHNKTKPMSLTANKSCKRITKLYIMLSNNTPPATRKNSALRGVTCFWGNENA